MKSLYLVITLPINTISGFSFGSGDASKPLFGGAANTQGNIF